MTFVSVMYIIISLAFMLVSTYQEDMFLALLSIWVACLAIYNKTRDEHQ